MTIPTIRPDFFIIGAQKSGTTWLWHVLNEHPETDLPQTKEIHYFGGVEKYRQGPDWYFSHFDGLDPSKVTGEASTTYLYDYAPYWHNDTASIEFDESLACIPELVTQMFPESKILVVLRDPVKRAVSSYQHWMRKQSKWQEGISPRLGLKRTALQHPKLRILEYGYYAKYLKLWQTYVPPERMRVYIFEEDVVKRPEQMLAEVCDFLGLDPTFSPESIRKKVHPSLSLTRSWLRYYTPPSLNRFVKSPYLRFLDRGDLLGRYSVSQRDIDFLRSVYLPRKAELEAVLGRSLDGWKYGA